MGETSQQATRIKLTAQPYRHESTRVAPYNHGHFGQQSSTRASPISIEVHRPPRRASKFDLERPLDDGDSSAGWIRSGIRAALFDRHPASASDGGKDGWLLAVMAVGSVQDPEALPRAPRDKPAAVKRANHDRTRYRHDHRNAACDGAVAARAHCTRLDEQHCVQLGVSSRDRPIRPAMIAQTTTDLPENQDASESASGVPSHQAERTGI